MIANRFSRSLLLLRDGQRRKNCLRLIQTLRYFFPVIEDPSFAVLAQFGLVGLDVEPFSDLIEKYRFIPLEGAINSQFWFSRRE